MKLIRVGAAVLNQTPLDWQQNQQNIVDSIEQARASGVSLLCLPELVIPGYGCDDAYLSPGVQRTSLDVLAEIVPQTRGLVVALGLPIQYRKALFNCVAVVADGQILGFVAKRYLAGDGIYYEPRWFKPWPARRLGEVDLWGRSYAIGDIYFRLDGVHLGFEICEEAWVATRPGSNLAARGVDIMLNPSASHFGFGRHRVRRRFVLEGSRAFGVSYVYSNVLGNSSGREIYDGGAMIASDGELLAEGPRFSFQQMHLTSAVIDVDETRLRQVCTASYQPDFEPNPGERIEASGFRFPELRTRDAEPETTPALWQPPLGAREEEFTRATALGLFDYLRKSRSRGFVVSLSGGADSAATSCLVALMVRLACEELGLAGFLERLNYLDFAGDSTDDLVAHLLLCVYQATRNSSQTTHDAAKAVADGIGARFLSLDVDALVGGYTDMVSAAVGRELSWDRDDLTLQNIQARVRAPSVWMLANLSGSLLLSTSNRSEAAVGYATMDGDTCGGLSPIGGIDKAFLRRWLTWLEVVGPHELGPVPAVELVNSLAPTAELRPHDSKQTDEEDLMPYDLLDAIEEAAIGDKKMPVEVFRTMRGDFPELDSGQLATWVERFFRLWCRNQWKRERYAPSFHVDDKNLDPKTWCRFPILSGGFERELQQLRDYVAEESQTV